MRLTLAVFSGAVLLAGAAAEAQTLSGQALVAALRKGGYAIVMRHASSPAQPPKLILGPDGKGGAALVARAKIQEWPRLAR